MTNITENLCVEVDVTSCIMLLAPDSSIKVLLDDNNSILDFKLTKQRNLNDELREQVLRCVDYRLPDRWTDFNSIFVWPRDQGGLEIITRPVWVKEETKIRDGYRLVEAHIALMLLGNTKHGQRLQTIIGAV